MSDFSANRIIYNSLEPLCDLSNGTKLMLCRGTNRLYTVKRVFGNLATLTKLTAIDSPYVAKCIWLENKGDYAELVSEFVPGETLDNLLRGGKTLDEKRALRITECVARGLDAIHRLGLVHRDINPNNIIITDSGDAKIIDFGIARTYKGNQSSDTTILGTPGYAAPEQFGFSESDTRADIYALGVLLNVMSTGKLPNEARAKGKINRIVSNCVSVDPEKRYESAADVAKAASGGFTEKSSFARFLFGYRSSHRIFVALFGAYVLIALLFTCYNISSESLPKLVFLQTLGSLLLFWVPIFSLPRRTTKPWLKVLLIILTVASMFTGMTIVSTAHPL